MAFIQRAVKVPPNSASLEEARHRVFDFFRQACRSIPAVMEIYNLDDVVTPAQLRSSISQQIRKNKGVSDPKVPPSLPISTRLLRMEWIAVGRNERTRCRLLRSGRCPILRKGRLPRNLKIWAGIRR
jgi:hypothetical protein